MKVKHNIEKLKGRLGDLGYKGEEQILDLHRYLSNKPFAKTRDIWAQIYETFDLSGSRPRVVTSKDFEKLGGLEIYRGTTCENYKLKYVNDGFYLSPINAYGHGYYFSNLKYVARQHTKEKDTDNGILTAKLLPEARVLKIKNYYTEMDKHLPKKKLGALGNFLHSQMIMALATATMGYDAMHCDTGMYIGDVFNVIKRESTCVSEDAMVAILK
jgi:hypothetical protein